MASLKSTRSKARKKAYQRVLRFPQAKGKIVSDLKLYVSPEDLTIDISFQDKTSLSFDVEPCVQVFPELTDWKAGIYKPIKRWRPAHSRSPRL